MATRTIRMLFGCVHEEKYCNLTHFNFSWPSSILYRSPIMIRVYCAPGNFSSTFLSIFNYISLHVPLFIAACKLFPASTKLYHIYNQYFFYLKNPSSRLTWLTKINYIFPKNDKICLSTCFIHYRIQINKYFTIF